MILVTGGAGYIGSHMGVALAQAGQPYLVLDNFSNSQPSVLERMGQIIGQQPQCIEGVICGRAIYSGDLDFAAAQERADALTE